MDCHIAYSHTTIVHVRFFFNKKPPKPWIFRVPTSVVPGMTRFLQVHSSGPSLKYENEFKGRSCSLPGGVMCCKMLCALEIPTYSPYLSWPEPPCQVMAAECLHLYSIKGNESSVTKRRCHCLTAGGGKLICLD